MSAIEAIQSDSWRQRLRPLAFALLALLLAVDLLLIGLYVAWGYDDWAWSLENEAGPSERFQHVKWAVATGLMLVLFIRRRAVIYAAWAVLLGYFGLDDSTHIHERLGKWIAYMLDLERFEEIYLEHFSYFYLRAKDFGELILAASLGAIIFAILWFVWPGPGAVRERIVNKRLVAWLFLFALFAVGFDMLHVMVLEIHPPAIELIGVIEDGGEMICASLLVAGLTLELSRS